MPLIAMYYDGGEIDLEYKSRIWLGILKFEISVRPPSKDVPQIDISAFGNQGRYNAGRHGIILELILSME